MSISRFARTSALVVVALGLSSVAYATFAQSKTGSDTQQSSEAVDKAKAEAEQRSQADEAAQKTEARKPKRDKSKDDKRADHELEEEEDI